MRPALTAGLAAMALVACGSSATGSPAAAVPGTTATAAPSAAAGSSPSPVATPTAQPHAGAGSTGSAPPGSPAAPTGTHRSSAAANINVTTPSAGSFAITGSDCGGNGSSAYFHFGVPGSGDEARIDVSAGWHGPGTYGPHTFGVSASVLHRGQAWLVNFQDSADATLTVDPGAASGRISYTSQGGTVEAVGARFSC
jgi:hypothetical protein